MQSRLWTLVAFCAATSGCKGAPTQQDRPPEEAPHSAPTPAEDGTFTVDGLRYREIVSGGAAQDDKLPMIVLLHGMGGRPVMFMAMTESYTEKARFILPFAIHPAGPGFAWFETSTGRAGPGANLEVVMPEVASMVATALKDIHAMRPSIGGLVVGGFSQGAELAYGLALLHPELFVRACPMAGLLPPELLGRAPLTGPRPEVHGFHGEEDTLIRPAEGQAAIAGFKTLGYVADMKLFPGVGHRFEPASGDVSACLEAGARAALAAP